MQNNTGHTLKYEKCTLIINVLQLLATQV